MPEFTGKRTGPWYSYCTWYQAQDGRTAYAGNTRYFISEDETVLMKFIPHSAYWSKVERRWIEDGKVYEHMFKGGKWVVSDKCRNGFGECNFKPGSCSLYLRSNYVELNSEDEYLLAFI
jgi:hypothetical protein